MFTTTPLEFEFTPDNVTVPVPASVRALAPLTGPANVVPVVPLGPPLLTVRVAAAPRVVRPVNVKAAFPVKVVLALMVSRLLNDWALPVLFTRFRAAPLRVSCPGPKTLLLPTL